MKTKDMMANGLEIISHLNAARDIKMTKNLLTDSVEPIDCQCLLVLYFLQYAHQIVLY